MRDSLYELLLLAGITWKIQYFFFHITLESLERFMHDRLMRLSSAILFATHHHADSNDMRILHLRNPE